MRRLKGHPLIDSSRICWRTWVSKSFSFPNPSFPKCQMAWLYRKL